MYENLLPATYEQEAARARADARDFADMALAANLAAAQKLWCVVSDHHEPGYVIAIYPTEIAARAALPLYEQLEGIKVIPYSYFPA